MRIEPWLWKANQLSKMPDAVCNSQLPTNAFGDFAIAGITIKLKSSTLAASCTKTPGGRYCGAMRHFLSAQVYINVVNLW
jgi:hypothetical protein